MFVPLLTYMGNSPYVLFVFDNKFLKSRSYGFIPNHMRGRQVQICLQRLCVRYEKILSLPNELHRAIVGDFVDNGDYGDPIFTDDDGITAHFFLDFVLRFRSNESVVFDHFIYVEEESDYLKLRRKSGNQITLTPFEAFLILSGLVFSETNHYVQMAMTELGEFQYTRELFMSAKNTQQQLREDEIRFRPPDKSAKRWIDRRIDLGLLFFDFILDRLLNKKLHPLELLRLNCGNYLFPMLEHKPVKDFFMETLFQLENFDQLDILTRSLSYYFIEYIHTKLFHLSRIWGNSINFQHQIPSILEMIDSKSHILEDFENSVTDS